MLALFEVVSDFIRRGIIRGTTKEEIPKEFLTRCEMYKSLHAGIPEDTSTKTPSTKEIYKVFKLTDNTQNSLSSCATKRRGLQGMCSVVILDNILLDVAWTSMQWDLVIDSLSALGRPHRHTLIFIVEGFQFHLAMSALALHAGGYITYCTAYSGTSTQSGTDYQNSTRAHVIYAFDLPPASLDTEELILEKLHQRRYGHKFQDIVEPWTTPDDKRRSLELGKYLATLFCGRKTQSVICPGNFNLISSFLVSLLTWACFALY